MTTTYRADLPPTPGGPAWRERIEGAVADARRAHEPDDSEALRSLNELIAAYGAHEKLLTERAERAEAEATAFRLAHADVWRLVGRCDLAFELIETSMLLSTAKRTAKQLHAEIKKASEP